MFQIFLHFLFLLLRRFAVNSFVLPKKCTKIKYYYGFSPPFARNFVFLHRVSQETLLIFPERISTSE